MRRPVGVKGNFSFIFCPTPVFRCPPGRHCRHASIRTLEERFVRSVQVGRSRFSRCCYLISALWFSFKSRTWARRFTQSPELGLGFFLSSSWNDFDFAFAVAFTQLPQ